MKFNSTVALTLILLAMMLGAGFVSSMWGFTIGHEALKGITQPDVRPTKKLVNDQQPASPGNEGVAMLREGDILANVRAYIKGKGNEAKTDNNSAKDSQDESTPKSSPSDNESPNPDASSPDGALASTNSLNLPIKSQDKGVTLEVTSTSVQGGSLLLNVSLKNEGSDSVRFLYSFLNVTDDKGRALSAITEGLPGELPANGSGFSGTVSIPTALLDDAKALSLTLTDYPDQKLKLKMSEIPVTR